MKKEFTTKYSKNLDRGRRSKLLIIIFVLIILLFATGFFVYKYQKPRVLVSQIVRVKSWFAENKNHLQKKLVKVKQVAENKNESKPEIHFEFYTTLPNMQIKVQDEQQTANVNSIGNLKIFDAVKLQNALENEIQTKK